jgi:hypothetical protein
MARYITRCQVDINGVSITDFKSFTEKAVVSRKAVPLMYKTGSADLTRRYQLEVDYVVPRDTTPFDFQTVSGGTLLVEYDSGETHTWGGVSTLEVGDATIDGENEMVRKVTFHADNRDGDTGA